MLSFVVTRLKTIGKVSKIILLNTSETTSVVISRDRLSLIQNTSIKIEVTTDTIKTVNKDRENEHVSKSVNRKLIIDGASNRSNK